VTAAARGAARPLVAVYALVAVAALGRSAVQICTRWHEARLAYALSAVAAALYLAIAVALTRPGAAWRRVAAAGCAAELAGVLTVGALSLAAPSLFPDPTVWSGFGAGYAFVPLALPVVGLAWLGRRGRARARGDAGRGGPDVARSGG
jgi:hypothetical protein